MPEFGSFGEGVVQQTGEFRIAAARAKVWHALNDPDVLAQCIEGCQSMTKVADDAYTTSIKAKVGPVSATFGADIKLVDLDPPSSLYIARRASKAAQQVLPKGRRASCSKTTPARRFCAIKSTAASAANSRRSARA